MGLTVGQQRCVDTLDRPLVVAAGAGSGKTFTLTKRIVGALQNGFLSDIDEVCAITFTKKAAAELKSRLKGELRACGLVEQALKVDEAWVSTIHGMCARILRAHAIELEIDPMFTVAEGPVVQAYLDRAVDTVLLQAQQNGSSRALDQLFAEYPARSFGGFGASIEGMLSVLVGAASSQADGVDSFVMPGVALEPCAAVEIAVGVMEDVLAHAAEEKESQKRDEWMLDAESKLEKAHMALEGGIDSAAEALEIIGPFKLAKTFGSKGFKTQVDEARGSLGACVMEVRLSAAQPHLEALVQLTRKAVAEFARLKRADGVLDNNDLLVQAARALEEHPSIAACYADKFKLVMVDEFQDTDQMQVDMIKRLAGEGACRLCTVGDAQQSIYRFRGADVSVYRRHLESVRASWEDSVIELAQNFRSNADVLSFVDKVFGQPNMFGGEFMSLSAGRDESRVSVPFAASGNRIIVQHTSRPWRGVSSGESCREAAHRVAAEFSRLAKAGHSAGDMVVLLGRMTNADVFAQALRAEGLSCVISGGSVFARTPEAAIVRELVRVIANPQETQSLFNVLTSPMFALTAGDLLQVGRFPGFWKAAGEMGKDSAKAEGAHACSPQLECALRVMGEASRMAIELPVSCIVEHIAVESGWLSRLEQAGAEGLASAGNVYKAIRMIRSVEQSGAHGPASVMRGFEDALDGSKEAPGALSVSGGNSVKIMTIHASKGLEFPIVAVAEVKEDSAPSSALLLTALGGKIYLSLDLGRSADGASSSVPLDSVRDYVLGEIAGEDEYAAAVAEDAGALHRRLALRGYLAAGDEEEAKRLLYVAITRAKEAVVISSTGKRTKDNPLGVPKSALAGIFEALDLLGAEIGEGVSRIEFGGSLPAVVECCFLEPEAPGEETPDAVSDETENAQDELSTRSSFFIPAASNRANPNRETYRALHEGIFSYSSIADASHKGALLEQLANEFAVRVDAATNEEAPAADAALAENSSFGLRTMFALQEQSAGEAEAALPAFDEDRATDLGTAFHRLAQYAVLSRGSQGGLSAPPQDRFDALSLMCNLNGAQKERLRKALDRWFGCELACDIASLPQLEAEVPFFLSLPDGSETSPLAFLEGEIDLLGFDQSGERAHVVDYKTGGRADEDPQQLREKHVLQASCYAYAVLLQGVKSVDADFVRVERGREDDPSQPQCVRYHFEASDIPQLQSAIASACMQAEE